MRESLNKKHDTLPQRFFNEELKTGATKGEKVQKQEFEKMLNEYYRLRGWNKNDRTIVTLLNQVNESLSKEIFLLVADNRERRNVKSTCFSLSKE